MLRDRVVPGGAIVFDHFTGVDRFRYTIGERIAALPLLDEPRFFHLHGSGVCSTVNGDQIPRRKPSMARQAPTPRPGVYDLYWYFASRRQAVFERRVAGAAPPWTDDPIPHDVLGQPSPLETDRQDALF